MSESEDPVDLPEEEGDDLFGEADEEQADDLLSEVDDEPSDHDNVSDRANNSAKRRGRLHDHDGHDDDEDDRDDGDDERDSQHDSVNQAFKNQLVMPVPMYRHRIPKARDGSLHSLKVPNFIKLNPIEYKPGTWEPSNFDAENANADRPFSSVLFRRDPTTGKPISNANVYRWNDGSVTLGIGDEQYEMQSRLLAPAANHPYSADQDSHYYAAAAHLTTNCLLIVGHFTEQYTVLPNNILQSEAFERLKAQMAEARRQVNAAAPDIMAMTREDPELQKKRAEEAEKERMRAQRRRDNAADRAGGGLGLGLGGGGGRYKSGAGGALSIGDLEGSGRRGVGAGGKKRGAPGAGKKKHRRPEYDSDDELPSSMRRPDNYDMDDGFLVNSDEESEEVGDDDDEEEVLDDEEEEEPERRPRAKRQKTADAEPEEDADGEADLDDDVPVHAPTDGRRRARNIVSEDEDE